MRLTSILCAGILISGILSAQKTATFNPTSFVVVGEGLAAGMADFSLRDTYQNMSFPAQMAAQMKVTFNQPLIQAPGIGNAPGFPALPVRLPGVLQGSVREPFPPTTALLNNLSIPGAQLVDAMSRKPSFPLIQSKNVQQTVINMILGYPAMIAPPPTFVPFLTQVEYANLAVKPTSVLVELGYYEVLTAAIADNPTALPDVNTFSANYADLLSALQVNGATVIATTIPDPFDSAYFTNLTNATAYLGPSPSLLQSLYGFAPDVYISPSGLSAIGDQIFSSLVYPPFLAAGVTVSGATATAVHSNIAALNSGITAAAQATGAAVYDLHGFIAGLKTNGLTVGSTQLTASYLGGIYSLDGYYPGFIGQAAIANDILTFLNSTYKTSFPAIDLTTLLSSDPAVRFTPSVRKEFTPFGRKQVAR